MNLIVKIVFGFGLITALISCNNSDLALVQDLRPAQNKAIAVFSEGCFWCAEYIFEAVPGVDSVVSGYAGGHMSKPTYEQIGNENTGNAESILVYYDPKVLTYSEIVTMFFMSHNPTTPLQQGPDKGEFYRSIAFYSSETEKQIIENKIRQVDSLKVFTAKVVTEIKPLDYFYRAKDRHQNYVKHNPKDPCVISESLLRFEKFKKIYDSKLRY
jgi:peptide-methionine (S)-S-oxide reductase